MIQMSARRTVGAMFGVLLVAAFDSIKNPELDIVAVIDDSLRRLETGMVL